MDQKTNYIHFGTSQVNFEVRQLNFPEAPRSLRCHIRIISNEEQDVEFLPFVATSYISQKPWKKLRNNVWQTLFLVFKEAELFLFDKLKSNIREGVPII